MTVYYVDPLAAGSNNGTSWANAWTGLQLAVDGTNGTQPVAGDEILCRGTETISSQVTFDGNSGDFTSGSIRFTGVNNSGVADGTKYVVDAANNGIVGFQMLSSRLIVSNFEIKNATTGVYGQYYTASNYCKFINVYSHDCSSNGFFFGANTGNHNCYIKCVSENNTTDGFNGAGSYCMCRSNSNGVCGFRNQYANHRSVRIYGCLSYSNSNGFCLDARQCVIVNCVAHANSNAGIQTASAYIGDVIGCRITSNGTGFSFPTANSRTGVGGCYMPDAGQPLANTTKISGSYEETYPANNFSGTDADGGYVDSSAFDFNLDSSAWGRRQEIGVNSLSSHFLTAGLVPADLSGGTKFHPLS